MTEFFRPARQGSHLHMQWVVHPRSKVIGYVGYRDGLTPQVGRLLLLQSGTTVLQTSTGSVRTVAAGAVPDRYIDREYDLVVDQDTFSPVELRTARDALGLSAEQFAKLVHVQSGRTVRKWEAGDRDIPGCVAVLTKALMASKAVREHFGVTIADDRMVATE